MLDTTFFALALLFQAPAPQAVPVLSRCDVTSDAVAQVVRDAAFDVHYSIDNEPTCYAVTLTVAGKPIRGYVFDRKLDAVIAFEKARVSTEQFAFSVPIPLPASAAPAAPAPKEPPKPATEVAKVDKKPLKPAPKATW